MKTLLLKKEEVGHLIDVQETIEAVEEAYKTYSAGRVQQPGYAGIHFPSPRGEIDFKVAYCQSNEIVSMKASSGGFTENSGKYGIPGGMGTILLFDARTCALICVMEGSLITGLRTGASGAVSVKSLARSNSKVITSIGIGNQARMQIRAISQVMEIEKVYAWNRSDDALIMFKHDIEKEFGIPVIISETKQAAVEKADILVMTTRGKGSLVEADWIKPGTHIIAIGADQQGKQELEPEIFRNAKIVVDSMTQCISKGETWNPLNKGIISEVDIYAEIGDILIKNKKGRENDEEITIFDSTGMAIQDNITAEKIYNNAIEKGIGSYFDFLD